MTLCKRFNLGHLWIKQADGFICDACGKRASGWRTWFFVPWAFSAGPVEDEDTSGPMHFTKKQRRRLIEWYTGPLGE